MKGISEKHPILFEIVLFLVGLLLSGIVAGILNQCGYNEEISSSIARILTGIVFLVVFHKHFKFDRFFKGFVLMLPVLLLAIYKIPYHFISGGGPVHPLTVDVLLIALAPAIFEEVLFRGILIANLKKKHNSQAAIVLISAVVFSLVHLTNILGMDLLSQVIQLIMALVAGIVLGAIYICTEDLISVIIAHFAIDVLRGIVPGGNTTPLYFIVIFAVLLIFETVYGFILLRRVNADKK